MSDHEQIPDAGSIANPPAEAVGGQVRRGRRGSRRRSRRFSPRGGHRAKSEPSQLPQPDLPLEGKAEPIAENAVGSLAATSTVSSPATETRAEALEGGSVPAARLADAELAAESLPVEAQPPAETLAAVEPDAEAEPRDSLQTPTVPSPELAVEALAEEPPAPELPPSQRPPTVQYGPLHGAALAPAAEPAAPTRTGPASIDLAIAEVQQVLANLRVVLEEMEEVLDLLEQLQAEKTADEKQIEILRQSLRSLQHAPQPVPVPPPAPPQPVPARPQAQGREHRNQPHHRYHGRPHDFHRRRHAPVPPAPSAQQTPTEERMPTAAPTQPPVPDEQRPAPSG